MLGTWSKKPVNYYTTDQSKNFPEEVKSFEMKSTHSSLEMNQIK